MAKSKPAPEAPKTITVAAAIRQVPPSGETRTLWGVTFTSVDEKLVAELPAKEAEAMIECGRAEKV